MTQGPNNHRHHRTDRTQRRRWCLIAAKNPRDEAIHINQDAELYATVLKADEEVSYTLKPGRHAWIQIARGRAALNGIELHHGDGAAVSDEGHLTLTAKDDTEALLFDLA